MKKAVKVISVLSALSLAALFTGCSSDSGGSSDASEDGLITVKIATDGTATGSAVALGVQMGFFEEQGLKVELTASPNPPAGVAALQSNEIDVASVPVIPALNAQAEGINIVSIAPVAGYTGDPALDADYDVQSIMIPAGSDIKTAKDLEGRKVGIPARKAIFEAFIIDEVTKQGGDPSTIEWIALDFVSQVEALDQGRIDAAALPLPFNVEAENNGATTLWYPSLAFYEKGQTSTWLISPKMQEDPGLVKKIQDAILKSNEYANEHRDEAIDAGSELTGISPDELRASGKFNYFPNTLDVDALKIANDKLVAMNFIKASVPVDDFVIPTSQ